MTVNTIDPLKLDWSNATVYLHVAQITARPARPGEIVKGEATDPGDMVVTTHPDNEYRISRLEFERDYKKVKGSVDDTYRSVEMPRRAVFVDTPGRLDAPWPGHSPWDLKKGEPVIEFPTKDNSGRENTVFISDPHFRREYALFDEDLASHKQLRDFYTAHLDADWTQAKTYVNNTNPGNVLCVAFARATGHIPAPYFIPGNKGWDVKQGEAVVETPTPCGLMYSSAEPDFMKRYRLAK